MNETYHAGFRPYPELFQGLGVPLLNPQASWGQLAGGSQRAGWLWANLWAPPGPGVQAVSSPGREDRFPGSVECRQRGLRKPVRAADGRGDGLPPLFFLHLQGPDVQVWVGRGSLGRGTCSVLPALGTSPAPSIAGARRSGSRSFQRPSHAEPG